MFSNRGAILAFLLVSSCARQPSPAGPQRIAILRFENLSANPSADWMGRAFSEVIATELAAAPDLHTVSAGQIRVADRALGVRPVSAPGISAEESGALAAGANRIGYGTYWVWNGKIEARLNIQDAATAKDLRILSASAPATNLLEAANALARQISSRAGSYSTSNGEALKAYATALDSPDPATVIAETGQAIVADPNFGPAYRLLAEIQSRQDRQSALALVDHALAHPAIAGVERARLEIAAAGLRNDAAALEQALAALAKLESGDAETWKSLAETAYNRHDFPQAAEAWRRDVAIAPEDAGGLNQLGYAAVYAHDLAGATAALRRYSVLRPQDPNALDSLGDVYLIAGHLKEAEDFYLQAVKKDANFFGGEDWFKAAMARLMAGDVAGADALAGKYADTRSAAHDPSIPIFNAEWQWLSGRRKAGYQALEQFARGAETGATRDLASRAYSQLAIWSLLAGDQPAAAQMSAKAALLAGPAYGVEAAMARFLAQPPASASEWQVRAGRLVPNPAQQTLRDSMLAYALLLSHQFQPAADVLQRLYSSTGAGNVEGLPVLLAWAYLETGREKDVAPLLEFNPVPPANGPGAFTYFYFPRIFDLRARLAESQGRTAQAKANQKLFAALSGSASPQ